MPTNWPRLVDLDFDHIYLDIVGSDLLFLLFKGEDTDSCQPVDECNVSSEFLQISVNGSTQQVDICFYQPQAVDPGKTLL